VEAFGELGVGAGCRLLVPRALRAREVLPDALRAMGADVVVAPVYQVVEVEADPAVLTRFRAGTVDCVTFTSGAIARGFVDALAHAEIDPIAVMDRVLVASIGPVTTDEIAEMGLPVDVEAPKATMQALAEAIAERFEADASA
jgi:uroporphyrinogen III methyltransferase/synthase